MCLRDRLGRFARKGVKLAVRSVKKDIKGIKAISKAVAPMLIGPTPHAVKPVRKRRVVRRRVARRVAR
jgi:hypothetical protein